jgi:hypothetical protein
MSKFITILLVATLVLSSCCGLHTEIKYTYKDIVITRIDECGKSSFYYKSDKNKKEGKIWAEYSGINSGFRGCLEITKDGKATVFVEGGGYFQTEGIDASLFEFKFVYHDDLPKIGETVCYISSSAKSEQENNITEGTGINIEYSVDDNEWW